MDPAKPGVKTSEFWLGVFAQGLVWWQAFDPSFHVTPGQQAKLTLAASAVSAVVTGYYMFTRKQVKTAAAHPLAFAPVPKGASAAGPDTLPFHAGVADHETNRPAVLGTAKPEDHSEYWGEEAKAAKKARPGRPIRKRG